MRKKISVLFLFVIFAASLFIGAKNAKALVSYVWNRETAAANWSARTGHQAVVFNNKIWIMGGFDGALKNDVWSSNDGITWTQATAAAGWSARQGFGAVVYNNKMWVMGGTGEKHDVWSSSDGITWTQATGAAAWSGRLEPQVVSFGNKMWVMGGDTGVTQKGDVWYSTDGITWTQATASAWPARNSFQAFVLNNKIWVAGGWGSFARKNDVWSSSDGITWTQATAAAGWTARMDFSGTVHNNKLWIMGGLTATEVKNDVWSSSDGITWTQDSASAEWSTRTTFAVTTFSGRMWVLGGSDNQSGKFNDVWSSLLPGATLTFTVNGKTNDTITQNTAASLSWTSSAVDSCTASVDWNGAKDTSGSESTGNLASSKSYTLTCINTESSVNATVNVTVTLPLPTINIKVNNSDGPISIDNNTSASLTWSSSNANSCTASGDWSGAKDVSGAEATGNLTASKTYTISCAGAGGTATDSVTVNISAAQTAAPTVDIKANNADSVSITSGSSATITWSSTNATACTASSDWSGAKATSGTESTGVLTSSKTYSVTCSGAGGSFADSVIVTVTAASPSSYTGGVVEGVPEGALIRAIGDIDVYIVKYKNNKRFKRLILSPSVFNSYQHLKWGDIKEVAIATANLFQTSELVRAVDDPKVYKMYPAGDTGEKRWVKTSEGFLRMGFDWDAIYEINQVDRDSYTTGIDIE